MEVLLTKEYISGLIERKGMSKAEFAQKMGYKRQNLDAMLDAKKKDINMVIKMAEVLGMSLDDLINAKSSGVQVMGFVKVNDKVFEIKTREDLVMVLDELDGQGEQRKI